MAQNFVEEFRTIPDFPNYEASPLGNIRSKTRNIKTVLNGKEHIIYVKGQLMKGRMDVNGYIVIQLRNNKKQHKTFIHRLVALAFIPNPENKPEVNHKNGIKHDNRLENLEWNTKKENGNHAALLGLTNKGEKNGRCKLNTEKVIQIRQLLQKGVPQLEIATIYNVSRTNISAIKVGDSWSHIKNKTI